MNKHRMKVNKQIIKDGEATDFSFLRARHCE